ncbi:hypothetical protein PR048_015524 [Dryococelus australis]|uniref:Uncharacterized protein n=1 Tax=Dryococelus australis TaxID=614101 RepID=A0ABQ9HHB6_9NEOP|nr:hypothetical protein PR048_015524 [Dryococelus australis]
MEQRWNKRSGKREIPENPAYQRHFPARFPHAKIREWPGQGLNPVRLGGRRAGAASPGCDVTRRPRPGWTTSASVDRAWLLSPHGYSPVTVLSVAENDNRFTRARCSGVGMSGRLLTSRSSEQMRVKRGEYGAALECKSGGNGRSPRKSVHQWHRPARFPRAIFRERPRRKLNPRAVMCGGQPLCSANTRHADNDDPCVGGQGKVLTRSVLQPPVTEYLTIQK